MYKKDGSDSVTLRSAGESARSIATMMHLERLGYIAAWEFQEHFGLDPVDPDLVRSSQVMNFQAPLLRKCREIQRAKPHFVHSWIYPDGSICVEDVRFQAIYWKSLIPILLEKVTVDILPFIFEGNEKRLLRDLFSASQTNYRLRVSQIIL